MGLSMDNKQIWFDSREHESSKQVKVVILASQKNKSRHPEIKSPHQR